MKMDCSYDENLSENPFFAELKREHPNVYQHCIEQSWILCIPRIGCLSSRVFAIDDFCAHILVPSDELPETHFSTLTGKEVTVVNKVLTIEVTKGLPLQSHILFEEIFYTEDLMKYKVWCLERPLEPTAYVTDTSICKDLTCINDCIDLLWTQAAGRQVLDQIELCVQEFLKRNSLLPIAIAPLRDEVSELYTKCLQTAFQNRRLKEKSKSCKQTMENIKISVECYMQHLLFDTVFKSICTSCSYADSHLNKKIRNLADIQLRDLDINKHLYVNIPRAKQILSKLVSYNTVLEKVTCLKRALNAINVNLVDEKNNAILITADDLLPVFVFLVLKSNLPNWYSQLTYMKEFTFSGIMKGDGDECNFLITTLEAVIEHINSGALAGPPNPESHYYESELTEEGQSQTESVSTSDTCEETLETIFELIKASQKEYVTSILVKNMKNIAEVEENANSISIAVEKELFSSDESDDDTQPKLCHPLCNCKRCYEKLSKNLRRMSPTVYSRDSHGLTTLHIASIHGKATIVESLIDIGAKIDATDVNECTPLHYAASRGHQNALLLLLHSGADINFQNIDKSTPLHMAVNNGHMNCVKALIYFAEHNRAKVDINCTNENGNTPLHLAAKWGYEGICRILIENGAEPSLSNKYNKTAFDYAHNLKIMNVLKTCSPILFEYIHINSCEVKNINCNAEKMVMIIQENLNKSTNVPSTVENLKRIERIFKAISYGDVKLACFYMNIDYDAYKRNYNNRECHPLCECQTCLKKTHSRPHFDLKCFDLEGNTVLHYAAQYGLEELCDILIKHNADVNMRNKKGKIPLHLASEYNKTNCIKLLLNKENNIDVFDIAGNTALHEAARSGYIGAVKTLLSYKPDITISNALGQTALDVAKEKIYLTIIDLIYNYDKNKTNNVDN